MKKRSKSFRPHIEALESRTNMSCLVSLTGSRIPGGVLTIIGDATGNSVLITQNDASNDLQVRCDGVIHHFASSNVKTIKVSLGLGDDEVEWDVPPGNNYFRSKTASISLGDGNNSARFDFRGGSGDGSATLSNNLNISVDSGTGSDHVVADFGAKNGGNLNFAAWLGNGNDHASASMWGDIKNGAKVNFVLHGGADNDEFSTVNLFDDIAESYSIDVDSSSLLGISMIGGGGDDDFSACYSGELDGKLVLKMEGGDGNDVNELGTVTTRSGSTGTVDARVLGDKGDDRLELSIFKKAGSTAAIFALMDGGEGFDTGRKTPNVQALNIESFMGTPGDSIVIPGNVPRR